jgi:Fic family protein
MPTLATRLASIENLCRKIEAYGKLPDELLKKIHYKYRLECNYHSNRIEGGTLTKTETRSVMIGNVTVDGKSLQDIREMKGHDIAMQAIFQVGSAEKRLSEKRILDIHRQIIVAETPEQEPGIGRWKTHGNHVLNYRGEKREFTPPSEVPEAIHTLLNWLNAGLDKIHEQHKDAPHPLLLAFEFHLRYLGIHPFTDGNGRTARLLTNLVLVSLAYPPFWVMEGAEKGAYNPYLADVQAYGASPDEHHAFLAGLVERSLKIMLDAIEGKDIEDIDDWKKKVQVLKNSLPEQDNLRVQRSAENIYEIVEHSIRPVIRRLLQELAIYDELFLEKILWFGKENGVVSFSKEDELEKIIRNNPPRDNIQFQYQLTGFKKSLEKPFSVACRLVWNLENYTYTLQIKEFSTETAWKKLYDIYYDRDEVEEIVRKCGEWMLHQIEMNIE